jgi:hemerythrin superfamily protein
MDIKVIKGQENYLYDSLKECMALAPEIVPTGDWRRGKEGNWVYTDDLYVCQILRIFFITVPSTGKKKKCIRTVCGSFVVGQESVQMLGENGVATNIYTFSGNYDSINEIRSKKTPSKKMLFAQYVAAGMDMSQAYSIIYPRAKDKRYIKTAANKLLQQKKVMEMVKQEIKDILNSEGVTPEYIIQRYKDIADISEKDSDKLRSLDALAKMSGLFDTEKKQEQLTVWTGFTPEQMEAIKDGNNKQEVLVHAEGEDK